LVDTRWLALIAVVLFTITAFAINNSWLRSRIGDSTQKLFGLALPFSLRDEVTSSELRLRRFILIGVALGSVVGSLISTAIIDPSVDLENHLDGLSIFTSVTVLGAYAGGWIRIVADSSARTKRAGTVVRPSGTRLVDVTGRAVITGAALLALVPIAHIAIAVTLVARFPAESAEVRSAVIAIAGVGVVFFAPGITLVIAAVVSRRRQAAMTSAELAWGDAMFARNILWPLFIVIFAFATSISTNTALANLVPPVGRYDELASWLFGLPLLSFGALVVTFLTVVIFRPWRAFLRNLWPDVHLLGVEQFEQLRAGQRAEREARNADFKRAHAGLPPLEKTLAD
jgi:hypothetical protein